MVVSMQRHVLGLLARARFYSQRLQRHARQRKCSREPTFAPTTPARVTRAGKMYNYFDSTDQ